MFTWLQANVIPVLFCAITSMVAALAIMFNLWQGAQRETEVYKAQVHSYEQIVQAQSRISENETRVNRVTDHVVTRIMESPNASTLVPPDIAAAWADGIDGVWNSGETPTDGSAAHVSRPAHRAPSDGKSDNRPVGILLGPTGSSVSKMQ